MTTTEILTSLKLQLLQALQKLAILAGMGNSVAVDTLLPWNMADVNGDASNHHNVRVLCDLEGLTLEQKNILAACVRVESNFNTQAIHINYSIYSDGIRYIASTDHGICQWNDWWHGKEITPDQATNNPEMAVRLMCAYFKRGQENQWVSFSSGLYKQYLGTV